MSDDLLKLFNELDDSTQSRESYIRAPFAYPGSKARSLDEILPRLPYTGKYVEVFGGSGAVLLARKESKLEIYNDRFGGIVAFYRCIRDSAKLTKLIERLEIIVHSREEFIWCRDTWENCEDDIERAARWYYALSTSFTSQSRNFGRSLNGTNGIAKKVQNSLKLFEGVHHRIKHVLIENLDWRQCLKDFDDEDTVFYLDPPYLDASSGIYKCSFTKADHAELLERVMELRGFCAVSGYASHLYDSYKWDDRHTWETRITITANSFESGNNQKHGTERSNSATECLWIKKSK